MTDHLLAQVMAGIIGLLTLLLGGISVKNRYSASKLSGSKEQAESNIFETQLSKEVNEKAEWRRRSEEADEQIRELERRLDHMESDYRHWRAEFALKLRFFKMRYPDVDTTFLDSGPAPLEPKVKGFKE